MLNTLLAIIIAMATSLKDIIETDDITLNVCIGVSYRVANTCLSSQVYNNSKTILSKQTI